MPEHRNHTISVSPAMSKSCLFIYGSLLTQTCDQRIRLLLKRHSRSLGKAKLPGKLLNLGDYPGLIEAGNSNRRVSGELLVLRRPENILPVLDKYECYDPARPASSEFIRQRRTVILQKNRCKISSWVYLYAGRRRYRQLVACGDYVRFMASR